MLLLISLSVTVIMLIMACFNTWTPITTTVFSQDYRVYVKDHSISVLWEKGGKLAMPGQKLSVAIHELYLSSFYLPL